MQTGPILLKQKWQQSLSIYLSKCVRAATLRNKGKEKKQNKKKTKNKTLPNKGPK